jgi:hypothetical protein
MKTLTGFTGDAFHNDAGKKFLRNLYNANMCILVIVTLDMDLNHGLAGIQQTVSLDFPQGKAYNVVDILKQKGKPTDVSADIELYQEPKKVKFNNTINYYNDIIGITT